MTHGELAGVSKLVGKPVDNHADERLGDIEEIMLDTTTGSIAYVVLSFGGFLGVADKLFAVPWSALVLDKRNERFLLNVDKARLKDAPGFDKDDWPDMSDEVWATKVRSYYGTSAHH